MRPFGISCHFLGICYRLRERKHCKDAEYSRVDRFSKTVNYSIVPIKYIFNFSAILKYGFASGHFLICSAITVITHYLSAPRMRLSSNSSEG